MGSLIRRYWPLILTSGGIIFSYATSSARSDEHERRLTDVESLREDISNIKQNIAVICYRLNVRCKE